MVLMVKGMTCDGCVRSVTRAIKRVAPEASVAVDLASGRVEVSGVAPEAARVAVEAAGYQVA